MHQTQRLDAFRTHRGGQGALLFTFQTSDAPGLSQKDGVALAAIQGLNEIVQEKDAQIADLEARLDTLEANGVPQGQFSIMAILPWVLLTITLVVLAFTFGKRQAHKTQ